MANRNFFLAIPKYIYIYFFFLPIFELPTNINNFFFLTFPFFYFYFLYLFGRGDGKVKNEAKLCCVCIGVCVAYARERTRRCIRWGVRRGWESRAFYWLTKLCVYTPAGTWCGSGAVDVTVSTGPVRWSVAKGGRERRWRSEGVGLVARFLSVGIPTPNILSVWRIVLNNNCNIDY